MMEYFCESCKTTFEETENNKQVRSLLIKFLMGKCPNCTSSQVVLTEKSKLLLNRKNKLKKIEESTEGTD